MPLVDNRVIPLAEVRVYDPGTHEPVIADKGWRWYDILEQSARLGEFARDEAGVPLLEVLPGVGLVCRPWRVLRDTYLEHYETVGGTWSHVLPPTGAPRRYRLVQTDARPNTAWALTSKFSLPENPCWVFSVRIAEAPPDHDAEAMPSVVQTRWGQGEWMLEFHPQAGVRLCKWNKRTGAYDLAAEVQGKGKPILDGDEQFVWVRSHRGQVLVSIDGGVSYTAYKDAKGNPITVKAGPVELSGWGRVVAFGLHEMRFLEGSYDSCRRRMWKRRGQDCELEGRKSEPEGTEVLLESIAEEDSDQAQYRATLRPAEVAGAFPCWRSPELRGVFTRYAMGFAVSPGRYRTPWDGCIEAITIDKPLELDQATATIELTQEAAVDWSEPWRWRLLEVRLANLMRDGSLEWWPAFMGHVRSVEPTQLEYNQVGVRVVCDGGAARAKTQEWDDAVPLGGGSLNEALDECMKAICIPVDDPEFAGRREWDPAGDEVMLLFGPDEDPNHLPKPGEKIWRTMDDLARERGFELGVDDALKFYTVKRNYVSGEVNHTWQGLPETLEAKLRRAALRFDAGESFTGIIVRGVDVAGNPISAGLLTGVEGEVTNPLFSPWPLVHVEQTTGATSPETLSERVVELYDELIPLRFEGESEGEAHLGLSRRDRVRVEGTLIGADGMEFAVMTLRHEYRADPTFEGVRTTAGLRRVKELPEEE